MTEVVAVEALEEAVKVVEVEVGGGGERGFHCACKRHGGDRSGWLATRVDRSTEGAYIGGQLACAARKEEKNAVEKG